MTCPFPKSGICAWRGAESSCMRPRGAECIARIREREDAEERICKIIKKHNRSKTRWY